MSDDIPPLRTPDDMPAIRNQTDLDRHWRALMGPLGFSRSALWLTFVGADDRARPMVTKVEDLPDRPAEPLLDNLVGICADLLAHDVPGGRVAFLYVRPGTRFVTDEDRAWARALRFAATNIGLPCEPIHLATDEQLRVFAPDDIGFSKPAA